MVGGKKQRKVDKYGRALEEGAKANELKRYYRMDEPAATPAVADEEEEDSESDSDSEKDAEAEGGDAKVDLARGIGLEESSDEEGKQGSDSDSDSEGSVTLAPATLRRRRPSPSRSPSIDLSETEQVAFGDESDEEEGEDEDVVEVEATKRIALVNMDWDHLRAIDLYRVLASSLSATALPAPAPPKPSKTLNKKYDDKGEEIGPYKPPSRLTLAQGRLLNVKIYPSSFGKERMEREEREGPPAEVFNALMSDEEEDEGVMKMGRKDRKKKKKAESSDDEEITERDVLQDQIDGGEGEDYDGEALRKYQLERLRFVLLSSASNATDFASALDITTPSRPSTLLPLLVTYMARSTVPSSSGPPTSLISRSSPTRLHSRTMSCTRRRPNPVLPPSDLPTKESNSSLMSVLSPPCVRARIHLDRIGVATFESQADLGRRRPSSEIKDHFLPRQSDRIERKRKIETRHSRRGHQSVLGLFVGRRWSCGSLRGGGG